MEGLPVPSFLDRSWMDLYIYVYIYIFRYISIRLFRYGSILLANRRRSIQTWHYIRKIFFEKSATADRVSRIHKIFRSFSTLFPNPLYRTDFCRSRGIAILSPLSQRLPLLCDRIAWLRNVVPRNQDNKVILIYLGTIPIPSPSVYTPRPFSRAIFFLFPLSRCREPPRWWNDTTMAERRQD